MKPVTLKEQIRHAKEIIEMYRTSWFMDGKWRGDPDDWRRWLIAHRTWQTLKALKYLRL